MNTKEVEINFSKRTGIIIIVAACIALFGLTAACIVAILMTAIDIAHESIGFRLVWQVLAITMSVFIGILSGFAAVSLAQMALRRSRDQ